MDSLEEDSSGVVGVLPEHDACQMMFVDVSAFGREGLRILVGDEDPRVGIIEIRHRGFGVPVTDEACGEKVGKIGIGEVNSTGCFAGLKEAIVFIGDLTPAAAIERSPQNEFARGNSGLQVLVDGTVGGDILGIRRVMEERSVMACSWTADVEVVGHKVDGVDVVLNLIHLGVLQEFCRGTSGNGGIQSAMKARLFSVETLAKLGEQESEVLFVFGTEGVAIAGLTGILPIDIEAVELIAFDKADGAGDKPRTTLGRERDVGEGARPGPAAYRDEDSQPRIRVFECIKDGEVFGVMGEAFNDLSILDIGKGVVDAGKTPSIDLFGRKNAVLREDVGDDFASIGHGVKASGGIGGRWFGEEGGRGEEGHEGERQPGEARNGQIHGALRVLDSEQGTSGIRPLHLGFIPGRLIHAGISLRSAGWVA